MIHTVGPIWRGGQFQEKEKLAECYQNSLQLAIENACKTIAFPNISTGVYGFPKDEAAIIAVKTVFEFVTLTDEIEKVTFTCFDEENEFLIKRQLELRH